VADIAQRRHVQSPDEIAKTAGGNERQQPSALRRSFSPHDDAPAHPSPISLQRKLNLWLTIGNLPARFALSGMATASRRIGRRVWRRDQIKRPGDVPGLFQS
jgi:hypothetical protein